MATCAADFSGWAGLILNGLGETGVATGSVVTWLENNLGLLNIALRTDYTVNGSGCVTGAISPAESGIYTEMYTCHYYKKKANEALGASSYDWTSVQGEEQGTIKRVSKNEIAKSYRLAAKDACEHVDKLIKWYHSEVNPNVPLQILNNSRTDVSRSAMKLPPSSFYSSSNFIWRGE